MSESFAELFEESISKAQMKTGSILNGTVVDIRGDYVIVNSRPQIGRCRSDRGVLQRYR